MGKFELAFFYGMQFCEICFCTRLHVLKWISTSFDTQKHAAHLTQRDFCPWLSFKFAAHNFQFTQRKDYVDQDAFTQLLMEYVPSITITLLNIIVPQLFRQVSANCLRIHAHKTAQYVYTEGVGAGLSQREYISNVLVDEWRHKKLLTGRGRGGGG